jgi:IPT/TIG domain-containing protein
MIPAPIQQPWGCRMMNAFTRSAVASLASLLIFPLVSLTASAQAAHEPHFRIVTAAHVGDVAVRELPTFQTDSHRAGARPFRQIGNLIRSDQGSSVPVALAPESATAAAASTATEQVVTGFTGVTLSQQVGALGNDQAVTPPDPQIAAGPSSLLEMVNSSGTVWTKTGTLVSIFDLNLFFKVPSGYTFSDPRVLFDAISGRWFASGVAFVAPSYGSLLVFSVSDTDDPAGTWHIYSADNSANLTHDQPKIGVSTDKVALSFNDFQNAAFFLGASTWVFAKSPMLQGASSIPGQAAGPDSSRVSIVPAIELTATSTEYMTYNNSDCGYSGCNAGYPSVGVVALNGDPAIGGLTWSESDPAIAGTTGPPKADQPGLPGSIDTNDDRFLTTVWANNNLWTVGNDACVPPGDGAVRPCPRLIQVSTAAGTTVNQNFDLGRAGTSFFFPAVHLDNAGDMYIVYNISSLSDYVGVRITGQPVGSAPQQVVTPQTIQPGQGLYTCFTRWGDYSGAAIDPASPTDVWVAGEYAGASTTNCEWATFVARLTFGASAPPPGPGISSISPTSGPAAGGTTVTIQGSLLSASGATTLVNFGPNQVSATCSSATTCTAVSPPGVGGPVSVTATVGGTISNAVSFTYIPALSTINPSAGPPAGGTSVTIAGTGFSTAAGATAFAFGANAATGVSCSSTTTCTAVTPSGPRSTTVSVTVQVNGVAGANSLSFSYRRK